MMMMMSALQVLVTGIVCRGAKSVLLGIVWPRTTLLSLQPRTTLERTAKHPAYPTALFALVVCVV
jgi:hypothetical protein